MPHHQSAKKRVRQTMTRTKQNKIHTTQARNAIKKVRLSLQDDTSKKEDGLVLLSKAQSRLSKLTKKGIIKKNSAARRTSRLAKQLAARFAPSP